MTIDGPSSAAAVRRNDIQGLRGISALLVVAFHLWTHRTAGAVDVFFVVSGYLLLGSLIRQHADKGAIDLGRYGVGILRRLLPMAVVVFGATVLAAQVLLPETRWDRAIFEAFASAVFVENYALIHFATDYLARDDVATPFASGWAISTQVQAYVLMAALMALVVAIPVAPHRRRAASASVLAAATLLSFGFAVWLVSRNQPVAYFSTWARLWEFTAGGLAAWALDRWRLPRGARGAAGWIGLAGLLATGWVLGLTRLFPGWASLWPVGSALLILAAGADGEIRGAGRVLAWRPLAWLGGLSYGVYLWHGPVVVFGLIIARQSHFGLLGGAIALGLSILLSAISKSVLEGPLARLLGRPQPVWKTFSIGLGLIVLMLGGVGAWKIRAEALVAQAGREAAQASNPGGQASPGSAVDPSLRILPRPVVARRDVPDSYRDGCHVDDGVSVPAACRYGPSSAPVTVALVGSSHSAHWLPAIQQIAGRRGWRVVAYSKSSCLFAEGATNSSGVLAPDCERWNTAVMQRLMADKPDLVVTLGTFGLGSEAVPAGSLRHWRRLNEEGVRILALRDTPWFPFDVADCVDRMGVDSPQCVLPRPPDPGLPGADLPANVTFADTRDWFCTALDCPPVIGNVLVYRDQDHLTATFARTLDDRLEPWIDRALAR